MSQSPLYAITYYHVSFPASLITVTLLDRKPTHPAHDASQHTQRISKRDRVLPDPSAALPHAPPSLPLREMPVRHLQQPRQQEPLLSGESNGCECLVPSVVVYCE